MIIEVSKIIPALQSRTTRFKFKQISKEDACGRLRHICNSEKINITDQALVDIVKISEGDMRKMVNTLQVVYRYSRVFTWHFSLNQISQSL